MKLSYALAWFFYLACTTIGIQHARSEASVRIDIIQPFQGVFLTERVDFFVRVSNLGTTPIRWPGTAGEDLFFEIGSNVKTLSGDILNLPKVENARLMSPTSLFLPPGKAYLLSNADYNEADFVNTECFTRVRVHLLIDQGNWVSSEWIERDILPHPDLDQPSLYSYKLTQDSESASSVISLDIKDETWLFAHHLGNPKRVGARLCRVPKGRSISSIKHDMKSRRLTIQFNGGEEPVVINTRTGLPITGSERTVPHLHLWRKHSGRPFTDFYQQIIEETQGKRDELDRSRTTVPALPENDEAFSAPAEPAHAENQSQEPLSTSFPKSGTDSGNPKPNRVGKPLSLWAGGIVIFLAAILVLRLRSKNRKDPDAR